MSVATLSAPISANVYTLLVMARRGLTEADLANTSAERYAAAHLAALRAAAAVLAARARPASGNRRGRPLSAWTLLVQVAPELGEWAEFFAAGARKRALAEAGLPGSVTTREADDLLRDATTFLAVVETKLGISSQPHLFLAP
ncbi:MAG: SAV_6107 family HEPN domain-containing protein [Mycobacteriales bacterium]